MASEYFMSRVFVFLVAWALLIFCILSIIFSLGNKNVIIFIVDALGIAAAICGMIGAWRLSPYYLSWYEIGVGILTLLSVANIIVSFAYGLSVARFFWDIIVLGFLALSWVCAHSLKNAAYSTTVGGYPTSNTAVV
eukprot:TRINITY_DN6361_c0_g1_i1.p1 TRINITY_DN6361_c0_g1~~TRINITY_DN6361_c0_g1_i1.p1  ORF type:complete len:136 (+),score=20.09 TRINITY_DN6361_c0_g1_i1:75-482(+)